MLRFVVLDSRIASIQHAYVTDLNFVNRSVDEFLPFLAELVGGGRVETTLCGFFLKNVGKPSVDGSY